jgi:hypothetical protein
MGRPFRSRRPTSAAELGELVDRIVDTRYRAAVEEVDRLRSEQPSATPAQLSDVLIRRAQRRLAAVAALSGGAAASPGLGTTAVLATAGLDAAWTMSRLAELIMAIGIAHGYDAPSFAERKAWVLAALAMSNGATGSIDELAGRLGVRGGVSLIRQLGPARLDSLNSRLAAKLATRLLVRDSLLTIGNVVPFGIGAGIGATGNALITRTVGKAAVRLFSTSAPPRRRPGRWAPSRAYDDVIDVEAEEVDIGWSPPG